MALHPIQQTERKHLKHEENRPVGEVGSPGTPVPSDSGASLSPNACWAMLGWGVQTHQTGLLSEVTRTHRDGQLSPQEQGGS